MEELEEAKIHFNLSKIRNTILVEIAVPGERWEVEFMEDNSIVIEKFISDGDIYDEGELEFLLGSFKD